MGKTQRKCPDACKYSTYVLSDVEVNPRHNAWRKRGTRNFQHHDGAWCLCRYRKEAKWARRMLRRSMRQTNRTLIKKGREPMKDVRTEGWATH